MCLPRQLDSLGQACGGSDIEVDDDNNGMNNGKDFDDDTDVS